MNNTNNNTKYPKTKNTINLAAVAGLIVAGLIAGIVSLVWFATPTKGTLVWELSKLLMQFVVIVVLGGIAKAVIDDHVKARERRTETVRYYKDIQQRAAKAYTDLKRVRRNLKMDFARPEGITPTDYRTFISDINDIQLELEMLNIDVKSSGNELSELSNQIKALESFVKTVVDGYRGRLATLSEFGEREAINQLSEPEQQFLSDVRGNDWYLNVVRSSQQAREILHGLIYGG